MYHITLFAIAICCCKIKIQEKEKLETGNATTDTDTEDESISKLTEQIKNNRDLCSEEANHLVAGLKHQPSSVSKKTPLS